MHQALTDMEQAAKNITITGLVQDAKTGEYLSGVTIYCKSDRTSSNFTNNKGRFLINLSTKVVHDVIVITHAGYERFQDKITLDKDQKINIVLFKKKSDKSQTDPELVTNALNGDGKAYSKLMDRYRDSIYFMIQKMVNNRDDAEDLTIEAFGKAFSKLSSYSSDYAFSTWLYRIAIHNCIDFVRKKRIATLSIDEEMENEDGESSLTRHIASNTLDPEEEFIREQRILLIRGVLDRLNPKNRKLIENRYLKQMAYEEIAKEMELPLGTVKAQLHRAKELLFNMLKKQKEKY